MNVRLTVTPSINSAHPEGMAFAHQYAQGATERERAVSLYLVVRDGLRDDPYRIDLSNHGMTASTALAQGFGWCVSKAVVLAAVARAAGIPARLGFADVRNHLSTEPLRQTMKIRCVHLARLHRAVAGRRLAQVHAGLQHGAVQEVWPTAPGFRTQWDGRPFRVK